MKMRRINMLMSGAIFVMVNGMPEPEAGLGVDQINTLSRSVREGFKKRLIGIFQRYMLVSHFGCGWGRQGGGRGKIDKYILLVYFMFRTFRSF